MKVIPSAPVLDEPPSLRPNRNGSVLAPFAPKMNDFPAKVSNPQRDRLRYSCAGVVEQSEEQSIPFATSGCQVTGTEDRLDLFPGQKSHQRPGGPLERDRQYALTGVDKVGPGIGQSEACEAAEGRESGIAGTNTVPAVSFEVVEKRENPVSGKGIEIKKVDGSSQKVR